MAAEFGLAYLGALPLKLQIREQATAAARPWSPTRTARSRVYTKAVARQSRGHGGGKAKDFSSRFPDHHDQQDS